MDNRFRHKGCKSINIALTNCVIGRLRRSAETIEIEAQRPRGTERRSRFDCDADSIPNPSHQAMNALNLIVSFASFFSFTFRIELISLLLSFATMLGKSRRSHRR